MRTFNVHAIGPSGSGKTVFMASMYRQLSLRSADSVFHLRTDPVSAAQLNAKYQAVADPQDTCWPSPDRIPSDWNFTVCVSSPRGSFEPLAFRYLDYPGGILTNPKALEDPKMGDLVEQLTRAHALLALLDGRDVLALLRQEPGCERFLNFKLTSTLQIVQQSRCPVHFVVTKWDLLSEEHTLAEVRDRLMADQTFADVVRGHAQDAASAVRLFPVSSVGSGFASLREDGVMVKTGQRLRPFQVELPFASVIPDFFEHAFSEISTRETDLLRRIQGQARTAPAPDARAKWVERGRELTARVVVPMLRTRLERRNTGLAKLLPLAGDELVNEIFSIVERGMERRQARAEAERHQVRQALVDQRQEVQNEKDALALVEAQFHQTMDDFSAEHPESLLAGPQAVIDLQAVTASASAAGGAHALTAEEGA